MKSLCCTLFLLLLTSACQTPPPKKTLSLEELVQFEADQGEPMYTTKGFELDPDHWRGQVVSLVGEVQNIKKWDDQYMAFELYLYPQSQVNQKPNPNYAIWIASLFPESYDIQPGSILMVTGYWEATKDLDAKLPYAHYSHLLGVCFINVSTSRYHFFAPERDKCNAWLQGANPAYGQNYIEL